MMRKLLATTAIIVSVIAMGGTAKANPFTIETTNTLEVIKQPDKATKQKQVKKKSKKHVVSRGDNLTKIAKMYNSSVQRLFNKNKNISNPDVLKVGQVILIPTRAEKLKHRLMSQVYSESPSKRLRVAQGSNAGNGYAFGNCTHYAKERRPDLPNNLGNADVWLVSAVAQGLPTGSKPKVGAVAVAAGYMHVAIVEKVQGNRVYISEKNYNGFNVVSSRWSDISEWQGYIY